LNNTHTCTVCIQYMYCKNKFNCSGKCERDEKLDSTRALNYLDLHLSIFTLATEQKNYILRIHVHKKRELISLRTLYLFTYVFAGVHVWYTYVIIVKVRYTVHVMYVHIIYI